MKLVNKLFLVVVFILLLYSMVNFTAIQMIRNESKNTIIDMVIIQSKSKRENINQFANSKISINIELLKYYKYNRFINPNGLYYLLTFSNKRDICSLSFLKSSKNEKIKSYINEICE